MKKTVIILAAVLISLPLCAQDIVVPPQQQTDTLFFENEFLRPDIFESVDVEQSQTLRNAFDGYISDNASRKLTGYRVRIYFDSNRQAREVSESIQQRFKALYPDVPVYRIYSSPFFKVTVGDFRTRDDAHRFAAAIASQFPSAFLVKETINFPMLWSNKD